MGTKCVHCYPPFATSAWVQGLTKINRRRWRVVRANQLAVHPLCQWPRCKGLAHEVDHRVNLKSREGQLLDPFDYANLQSLCKTHHKTKTGREGAQAAATNRAIRAARNSAVVEGGPKQITHNHSSD